MIAFDAAHEAVHYPPDRRFRIWIRPSILIGAAFAILALIAAAWIEVAVIGMPRIPPVPQVYPNDFAGPHGFPLWVRYCHFFNFFFVMLLIRSGLSILMDHPRLYFNDHCTPGSEWIRFTPLEFLEIEFGRRKTMPAIFPLWSHARIPAHHRRRADLAFHYGPRIYRHGRYLHRHAFRYRAMEASGANLSARAPAGLEHLGALRNVHLPAGPNGFYGYNALQQIAYFVAVFVFGVLAILTGIAMSPAVVNRFQWYAKIFGGRQAARSIHFLTMLGFLAFLIVHVTLDRDDRLPTKHEPHCLRH